MEWVTMANFFMGILELVLGKISQGVKDGQITPGQQLDVRQRYEALKNNMDKEFLGPEWQIEPAPQPPTPLPPTPQPPPP